MSDDTYQPNTAGIQEFLNSPRLHEVLGEIAEKGKAIAESFAEEFRRTGEYAQSFSVSPETLLWRRGPRAGARLENSSDHAAAVEWGNQHDPHPHRTLGRTLDSLKTL